MGNWLPPPVDANETLLDFITVINYNNRMNTYLITHTHRHGHDTQIVRCEDDLIRAWNETNNVVAFAEQHFSLDFEPHLEEEIEIEQLNLDSIPVLTL